jgi:uncharacterized membrane protein YphA (DoxX/SURF4 family)
MRIIRICLALIARFFISLVFLAGAISKILHWRESETSLLSILCEWQSNIGFSDELHECFGVIIPLTPILLLAATVFEFLGGLLVLLGIKERLGAGLLIVFLIPATIIMHQFWFVDGTARELQLTHFLKNLAILGGLMVIFLQGTEQEEKHTFPKF